MKNTFIVTDTNVFIDLHSVSLLDAFFHLPWEIHTPDYVIKELTDKDQLTAWQEFIEIGQLKVNGLQPDDFMVMAQLINSQRGVSNLGVADCSVWILAKKLECPLLTGDAMLRAKAKADNIEVHGVLYVFDCLVECGIIQPQMAAQRLKRLFNKNHRLPEEHIMSRVAKWEKIMEDSMEK